MADDDCDVKLLLPGRDRGSVVAYCSCGRIGPERQSSDAAVTALRNAHPVRQA